MNRLKMKEFKQTIILMDHRIIYMICILISCMAYAAYQIMTPFVNMYLINSIIGKNISQLILSFILLVLALIIAVIVDPFVTYQFNQCINTTVLKLRIKMFSKIEGLGNLQVKKYTSGDLISRMTNDISAVERMFGPETYMLITSIIYGVGSAVSMFILNWRFSLIIFIMAVASVFVSLYWGPQLHIISERVQKEHAVLNQYVIDSVLGSKSIKIFNIYDYLYDKYCNKNEELIQDEMKKNRINSKINTINFLVNAINVIGAFSIGAIMVNMGLLDFGTIIAVIGLQKGVIFMFENVGKYYSLIQTTLAASSRIFEILNQETYLLNNEKANPTNKEIEKISTDESVILFDHVTFGYSDNDVIIDNLSLKIKKDEIVEIMGKSGTGKSTLIKLILGFYSVNEGQIYVNSKKVNEDNIRKIRDNISYVPQDAFLFDGTIKQNIICNQSNCSYEEVVKAGQMANAHDFIMSLPDGYDTVIRENASNFSSGQKQRIAIARAFLKNAQIILMDEPTSSLDAESERKVKQALEKLCYGKTVIIITHRSGILENVTKKYVLKDGILTEQEI